MKPWYKRKTTWAAIVLAATVGLPAFVPMTPVQIDATQKIIAAVALIFMRDAIEKS